MMQNSTTCICQVTPAIRGRMHACSGAATHQEVVLSHVNSGVHKLLVGDLEQPRVISDCAKRVVGPVQDVTPEAIRRHATAHITQLSAQAEGQQGIDMQEQGVSSQLGCSASSEWGVTSDERLLAAHSLRS
eukprot:GHRQ01032286.1.p1 GENE.GHRQ01032286.1~~GHRQ01032286.1.p1  ORF type:complete len:131 (-),score=21.95 GHRQ01032286.1:12-404(-)